MHCVVGSQASCLSGAALECRMVFLICLRRFANRHHHTSLTSHVAFPALPFRQLQQCWQAHDAASFVYGVLVALGTAARAVASRNDGLLHQASVHLLCRERGPG
jgi:hypothetical protein